MNLFQPGVELWLPKAGKIWANYSTLPNLGDLTAVGTPVPITK
jgi:hypothetical protein